jgi:hypothetical protein
MASKKSDLEKTETGNRQQKPIVDQMTDLAAQAAGTLAETAVRAVAQRAKKEAGKRLPSPAKRAAKTVSDAAKDKKRAPASKDRRKSPKKSASKKSASKKATAKKSPRKSAKKSKTRR